jgi:hypothetical protein
MVAPLAAHLTLLKSVQLARIGMNLSPMGLVIVGAFLPEERG